SGSAILPGMQNNFSQAVPISNPSPSDPFIVGDVDVTVNLVHPNLANLQLQLIAPNGMTVTLVQRGATTPPQGLTGANLGAVQVGASPNIIITPVGTVFNQQAARNIRDGSVAAPFVGDFQPEIDPLNPAGLGLFNGLTPASLADNHWTLRI